jgi:glycosyltransferase involved in cell wall biosynthesis
MHYIMSSLKSIRISVIIPCFNDGEFLEEAIASVEASPDPIYEIIIVNDGSKSLSTLNILNELKSKGYKVVDQENRGPAAARNAGIRAAQGEYILPVDSDCRIRSTYISRGAEILDRYPDVAVVYADVEFFGEETGVRQVPDLNLSWLVNHNYIDNCAVFRKSVWEECGSYDEKMPFYGFEDWDLWLSIAKRGYQFYHIPEVLFEYRVRLASVSTAGRGEEKARVMSRYIASKHASFFPKEFRYYYKPYRKLHEIWQNFQLLLGIH